MVASLMSIYWLPFKLWVRKPPAIIATTPWGEARDASKRLWGTSCFGCEKTGHVARSIIWAKLGRWVHQEAGRADGFAIMDPLIILCTCRDKYVNRYMIGIITHIYVLDNARIHIIQMDRNLVVSL